MKLNDYIAERLKNKKILLMTHAVVGYPSLDDNWKMLEMMAEAGVDLVELQMPFTEPSADGPTFARVNQLALEKGIVIKDYFDFMTKASQAFDFPILMMSYYNPIYMLGHQKACDQVKRAGGAGFIIPDLPVEEYGDFSQYLADSELASVALCSPTNTDERLEQIFDAASDFIYCVARRGVTGAKTEMDSAVLSFLERCRSKTDLPLSVGFGLSSAEDVKALHGAAEIAIVGSAMFNLWEKQGQEAFQQRLHELVAACS